MANYRIVSENGWTYFKSEFETLSEARDHAAYLDEEGTGVAFNIIDCKTGAIVEHHIGY